MQTPDPQRRRLVALLILGQLVCVLGGLLLFERWLGRTVHSVVRERVYNSMSSTADLIVSDVDEMATQGLKPGTPGHAAASELIRGLDLTDDSYVSVVEPDGTYLIHPDPGREGQPARVDWTDADWTGESLLDLISAPESLPGFGRIAENQELIVARPAQHAEAILLVHVPKSVLGSRVERFLARVRSIGSILAFALVLVSAVVAWVLLRGYESGLARVNEELEEKVAERTQRAIKSRDAVIYAVARVAEARDEGTGQHLDRISKYTEILAAEWASRDPDLDDNWVRTVSTTAILHDIGKVGIPDEVLLKPGPLTDDERRTIEKHPFIGGDTMMAIKRQWGDTDEAFMVTAAQIIFAHHERWDGGGYPYGLSGEDIPLPARLVALADVYDALTSVRPYKQALTHDEARQRIADDSGTHFDPTVVEVFLAVQDQFADACSRMQDDPGPVRTAV